MAKNLTPQQLQIIIDHKLRHTATISIPDMALYADFYSMLLENPDQVKNRSHLFQEAMECLKAHGLNWRAARSDNGKLDEILRLIKNQRFVEARPGATKEEAGQQALDTTGGFSE